LLEAGHLQSDFFQKDRLSAQASQNYLLLGSPKILTQTFLPSSSSRSIQTFGRRFATRG
jgi:hypothetical protein